MPDANEAQRGWTEHGGRAIRLPVAALGAFPECCRKLRDRNLRPVRLLGSTGLVLGQEPQVSLTPPWSVVRVEVVANTVHPDER